VPASARARRYAEAAYSVANDSGEIDLWVSSLDELARVLRMPSARNVFLSPVVPAAQKTTALARLLPAAPQLLRNFLGILIERGRLAEVSGIAEALREQVNQERGMVIADVTTAVPLDPEMERLVAERLAAYLHRDPDKVTIRAKVDPAIIGGVVARIGDRLIDDSIRGRLTRLRRTLATGTSR
jgi:F-type H+-transporting ATPase subunit delta